jgi:hypothetical protein
MKDKTYFVYRYQYVDMRRPAWDAVNIKYGIDSLPCTVLAHPGVLRITAKNKKEALKTGKLTLNLDT